MGLQERLEWNKNQETKDELYEHERAFSSIFQLYEAQLVEKIQFSMDKLKFAEGQYHFAFGALTVDEALLKGVIAIDLIPTIPGGEHTHAFLKIPKPHEPWRDWSRQVEYILNTQYAYLNEWMLPTGMIKLPNDEYLILQKAAENARSLTVGELLIDQDLVLELERFLDANDRMMRESGMGYDILGAKAFGGWVSFQLQAIERKYMHLLGAHVDIYQTTWKSFAKPILKMIRKKFAEVWDFVYDDGEATPRLENILVVEEKNEHGHIKKKLMIQDIALMFGVVPGVNDHLPTMWTHAWNHRIINTTTSHVKSSWEWLKKAQEEWSKREIIARMCAHYEQATVRSVLRQLKTEEGKRQIRITIERSKVGWQ